jgi:LacI family transcriptional regulator
VDVAREAGVSVSTASVVLNPPVNAPPVSAGRAARVREAARSLGYTPNYHARTMRTGRAMNIAFVVDTGSRGNHPHTRLASSYFSQMLAGVEAVAAHHGYSTMLFGASHEQRALEMALEGAEQRRVDGLVICELGAYDVTQRVIARKLEQPLVFLGGTSAPANPHPVVEWPTSQAIALAIDHLAEQGHRSFLWVNAPNRSPNLQPGRPDETERREADFFREIHRRGLQGDCLKLHETLPNADDLREQRHVVARAELQKLAAERALSDHLDNRSTAEVTAILGYNDTIAIGCVGALHERGVDVPRDISVVGIDDIEAAFCVPALTTVSHELVEMGQLAASRLLELIEEPARKRTNAERIVVEPRLIVRRSTAAVRR